MSGPVALKLCNAMFFSYFVDFICALDLLFDQNSRKRESKGVENYYSYVFSEIGVSVI